MTWTRKRREDPGRPGELEGECVRINISMGSQMKDQLSRKTQSGEVSRLVRDLLKAWMEEHGCARLDIRVTPLNLLRVADRQFAEENNFPRLMHPEDILPTFIVEGKFTGKPLYDLLPAVATRHTRQTE